MPDPGPLGVKLLFEQTEAMMERSVKKPVALAPFGRFA
jgi:hypothetical protein